jgi:hypothetical protein
MSLYSLKTPQGGVQPWSQTITLAEAGKGCDGLFSLYDSLGDKTLVGANFVLTLLDGPEKVVRYGALTIGDGALASSLTASQRCKGLVILCDSLTVKNNATLNMTARGARVDRADDPFFPFISYKIPFEVNLSSARMSLVQALAAIKSMGLAPWDLGTFQHIISGMFGFSLSISTDGAVALLDWSAPGGGGAAYKYGTAVSPGNPGSAGTNGGMGGGGGGGLNYAGGNSTFGKSGSGCPYSGGSGGGGAYNAGWTNLTKSMPTMYSGPGGKGGPEWTVLGQGYVIDTTSQSDNYGGGGAGNPGGLGATSSGQPGESGTGGKLTVICRGALTVQSGGKIEANGCKGGGSGSYGGGGGSGGGHISLISPAAPSNAGTIQCAGGIGGANGTVDGGTTKGGDGGAGSVVTKTFIQMGW